MTAGLSSRRRGRAYARFPPQDRIKNKDGSVVVIYKLRGESDARDLQDSSTWPLAGW